MTINRPGAWRVKSSCHPAIESQITVCAVRYFQAASKFIIVKKSYKEPVKRLASRLKSVFFRTPESETGIAGPVFHLILGSFYQ